MAAVSASDPSAGATEAEIGRLRRNIDEVDAVLLKLLNQRAKWALEIGRRKQEAGQPLYQPEREAEVLAHAVGGNRGPLGRDAVGRLFERIIDESRRLERLGGAEPEGHGG
jgi:chorismate mutase